LKPEKIESVTHLLDRTVFVVFVMFVV
jgi:hypothetical protein